MSERYRNYFCDGIPDNEEMPTKIFINAWDTEIWVAEEPTHMIHKNGNKFLDAHSNTISKISRRENLCGF